MKCNIPNIYFDQYSYTCVAACDQKRPVYTAPINHCAYCKAKYLYLLINNSGVSLCVADCTVNGQFANKSTMECYLCVPGQFFYPPTNQCVTSCLAYNMTWIVDGQMKKCIKCKGWRVPDTNLANENSCLTCPITPTLTYYNPKTRKCVSDCTTFGLINLRNDLGGDLTCFDCPPYYSGNKQLCMTDCYNLVIYSHMVNPSENRFGYNMCDTKCCPC